MNYNGLNDVEELFDTLENKCKSVLKMLEDPTTRDQVDIKQLPNTIGMLKKVVYASSISTFISTFKTQQEGVTENEQQQIMTIVSKWQTKLDNIDEELHNEFLDDLKMFSEKYPFWFKDGTLISKVYNEYIWKAVFEKRDIAIKYYCNELNKIYDKYSSIYYLLINTNFTTIDPYEFEEVVKNLFISKGYESYTTPKSNDYGVDVIAKLDNRVIAIQVKKYSKGNNVSNVDIQKLLGAMTYKDYKATEALFITTSDYTTKAKEQAKNNPIELWDGEKIKNEIEKYLCK